MRPREVVALVKCHMRIVLLFNSLIHTEAMCSVFTSYQLQLELLWFWGSWIEYAGGVLLLRALLPGGRARTNWR